MPYTAPTLAQAQVALASRLNDQFNVQWVAAELTLYIQEALRTWNAWTSHWRERGTVTGVLNEPFYDLPTELPTLRGQTLTNWDMVTQLQYALLEPAAAGGTWTGTDQFDLAQLSTAIGRRRDQFLRETGAVLTRAVTSYPIADADGLLDLDEAVLIVRRALWTITALGYSQPLIRDDSWMAATAQISWPQDPGSPYAFSVSDTPPLVLQLLPPASTAGTLDLVTINKGTTVDPLTADPLGVPNDWAWVVKYGALADLLAGDGLAFDPARAKYCESRWDQGVQQASKAAVVIGARINGQITQVASLTDADRYAPLWQLVASDPETLLTSGHTLLASWPPPGAGAWTFTLDVVRNAPVPTIAGDVIQISADVYDSILDYAQHLAIFKLGPGSLELSMPLLERAARAAGITIDIQQASQPSRRPLVGQTVQDEAVHPRQLPGVPVT